MATRNAAGQAIATPSISHVLALDLAIRKKQAERMNERYDFKTALEMAKSSERLFQVNFLICVAIDINTAACRAVTAPGVTPANQGTKRSAAAALEDGTTTQDDQSKSNAKRAKKRKQEQAAKAAAAANAKSQSTQSKNGKGKGKHGKKGTGKGGTTQLPDGINYTADSGAPICWSYNQSKSCPSTCTRMHVCWWCGKKHPGRNARGTQCQ